MCVYSSCAIPYTDVRRLTLGPLWLPPPSGVCLLKTIPNTSLKAFHPLRYPLYNVAVCVTTKVLCSSYSKLQLVRGTLRKETHYLSVGWWAHAYLPGALELTKRESTSFKYLGHHSPGGGWYYFVWDLYDDRCSLMYKKSIQRGLGTRPFTP